MNSRVVTLQGVENVRDLGGIAVRGGLQLRPGLLYRGGALHKAAEEDLRQLFSLRGIRHVLDVRCGWELERRPDLRVSDVDYVFIPFFDGKAVGVDYEKPLPGTRMVGHDFACDPLDFYAAMANPLTVGQIRRAVNFALERAAAGEPVYQHCSGGKDRAGILSAVELLVLGASYEDVLADYELTNASRDAHYAENFARFRSFVDDDELAREITLAHRARPENLATFFKTVRNSYGSFEKFMAEQLGIDAARRDRLCNACCE